LTPEECLRAGQLDECLALLQDQVRRKPASAEYRTFLFQLQSVLGQWQRALNQLQVLADMGPELEPMVRTYREAVQCEALRAEVFAGRRSPLLFGEPEPWTALMLKALQLDAAGPTREAAQLRTQALEQAPATAGTLNGQPFAWIADADSRLGPILEVITGGRYYWLPFHRITAIRIDRPKDLRDLVWTPAFVTLTNGGELASLVPSRYPGSESAADAGLKLGRLTEWQERLPDTFFGVGQRLLATDLGELPLLEVREIQLAAPASAPAAG
jgi:type VI secretion system protein ImpE